MKAVVLLLALGCTSARTGCALLMDTLDDMHQRDRISALERELEALRREIGSRSERADATSREQSLATEGLRLQIARLERELAAERAAPAPPAPAAPPEQSPLADEVYEP